MADVRITVKRFDRLKEFPEIASGRFGDAMSVSLEKVLGDALPLAPVGVTGFYRSAFGSDTFIQATPFQIEGSVLNEAPYAAIIEGIDEQGNQTEFGRRPGAKMPPFDALRTWVIRVLGTKIQATVMTAVKAARKGGEKISAKTRAGRQESAIDSATWAIGRAIARRGIKAKAPLQTSLKANEQFIQQAFDDAGDLAAKDIEGV
jgi:hypothetical protein